jgi:hypothetical protein
MKFMSLREILVMFVCDMPMFVGQTFVGEISYIYVGMGQNVSLPWESFHIMNIHEPTM